MRFVLGVTIGLGIGFAAAILLAPKKQDRATWQPRSAHDPNAGRSGWINDVRDRFDEALMEADEARRATEEEMRQRYLKSIGKS
jgi:hypothetical protein